MQEFKLPFSSYRPTEYVTVFFWDYALLAWVFHACLVQISPGNNLNSHFQEQISIWSPDPPES